MTEWEEDCMKYWGKVLTGPNGHWCNDWDGLPIDDSCQEVEGCVDFERTTPKPTFPPIPEVEF